MTYFSRLTDIVTCNLSKILAESDDPKATIAEIIVEMEEGLAGAERSVNTATANETRLSDELKETQEQIDYWTAQAKEQLTSGNEDKARLALVRKKEVEALAAGLQQQLDAASATHEHLLTTQRALEARLADARRRQLELDGDTIPETPDETTQTSEDCVTDPGAAASEIDDELEALKRELGQA